MRNALALFSLLATCLTVAAESNEVTAPPATTALTNSTAQPASPAETNAVSEEGASDAGATTPGAVQLSDETHIRSESVDLGIKTRTAVYRGNVRLDDPRLHLTCEYLFANIPEEGQVDRIVAETNVVIEMLDEKGLTNWAYADKAVYTYQAGESATNEIVELTGSPRVEREEGILYGDTIIWDRALNQIRATNQRMGPRRETAEPAETNAPPTAAAARSNAPAEMNPAPATGTPADE